MQHQNDEYADQSLTVPTRRSIKIAGSWAYLSMGVDEVDGLGLELGGGVEIGEGEGLASVLRRQRRAQRRLAPE